MRLVKFVFLVSTQADEAALLSSSGPSPRLAEITGGDVDADGDSRAAHARGGEERAARNLDASDAVATRRRLSDCPAGKISNTAPDFWPAGSRTVDVDAGPQDLGELEPPVNYELSFTIKIDDSGLDSGDEDYMSIVHVTDLYETGGTDFPRVLFHKVDDSQNHVMYVREQTYMQSFIVEGTTVFAAGQTYEIKVTKEVVGENSRVSLYVDGVLEAADELDKDWYRDYEGPEGQGRLKVGWSPINRYVPPAQATISNAHLLGLDYAACETCAAGTYSSAGSSVCTTCPFGKYSGAGQATCTNCGDAGYNNYDQALWDPSLDGLASEDECKCEEGHKGANCELLECTSTTPVVSLGFLLLEVQWPRHARRLSRNEAFSGISAAFRAFDANSDNRLSVDEVRASAAEINKIIYRGGGRRLTRFSRRRGWG